MPIPTKPLRDILYAHLSDVLDDGATDAVEAAMRALAEYDPCFAKAAEAGEPTFTLRAQDQLAAGIVHVWSNRAYDAGVDIRRISDARDIAEAMRAWPNRRLPD